MLPLCAIAGIYFLIHFFITLNKYFKMKSTHPLKGEIIKLKNQEVCYDGKNAYKKYVYEFSSKDNIESIDIIEKTSLNKKSKLFVGMNLDVYYNIKTHCYESMQELIRLLIHDILGFTLFTIILIVGGFISTFLLT